MSNDEGMESSDVDSNSEEEMLKESPVKCLFCNHISLSIGESAKHCISKHSFDIRSYIMKSVTSHYDLIKLITYLRQQKPSIKELEAAGDSKPWVSDDYLLPVNSDDPWLWADDGLVVDDVEEGMEPKYVNAEDGVVTLSKEDFDELQVKNQRLKLYLAEQEKQLDTLRNLLNEEVPGGNDIQPTNNSDMYFNSYSDFNIHTEMLRDNPRMEAYQLAIDQNLFKGKSVLDVGCGTGILSMLAASAGATKVVGVENSGIFDAAVEIVRDNGLESKVTLVKGDIENIELDCKFDIIISEWMGYFLLFERMLESIIIARDKFLKADGILLPSSCNLYLAGCSDLTTYSERTNCFVLGYKMEPMKRAALLEPAVERVKPERIVTEPVIVHKIVVSDRKAVKPENCCAFSSEFSLKITEDCQLTSFCGWFDCLFLPTSATLSTSPFSYPTHWAQTNFYLKKPLKVTAGSELVGTISVAPQHNRGLQITLEFPSVNVKKTYILQ